MLVEENILLRSNEADRIQGFPLHTHKQARSTGSLYGAEPPPFIRIGKSFFYYRDDLDNWLAQFPKCRTVGEFSDLKTDADKARHTVMAELQLAGSAIERACRVAGVAGLRNEFETLLAQIHDIRSAA